MKKRSRTTREIILAMVKANPRVSLRELREATYIRNSSNIQYHLNRLKDEGLIQWEAGGTKKRAWEQKTGVRWQRGDVSLRRMSKKEEQARIDAVVKKALSNQQLADSQSEDVMRDYRHVRGRTLKAIKF